MGNIIVAIINLPFRALDSLMNFILFPQKPPTPDEHMLKKARGQYGQIRAQQGEISALLTSIREREYLTKNYEEQLAKRDAELQRSLKKIRSLEFEKLQG